MLLNNRAKTLCDTIVEQADELRIGVQRLLDATILDFGIEADGGIQAGLKLASICLGDLAEVSVVPQTFCGLNHTALPWAVQVTTDHPVWACLGGQYAGWPVQTDSYFAMGSGPMRLARGREEMLAELALTNQQLVGENGGGHVVGVLETDQFPSEAVVRYVAEQCSVPTSAVILAVAPVTSLAGTIQVVARSVETSLHKFHALGGDPRAIVSAAGIAPLPPLAKNSISGIGRTNDAILYGGCVTLWVDLEDQQINQIGPNLPSTASHDHGRPFADIFKSYDYDFYKVDPHLFSPAVVTLISQRTGRSKTFGRYAPDVLAQSFKLDAETSLSAGES